MTNDEILAQWYVKVINQAGSLWDAGYTERAIELLEALQHYPIPGSTWAHRQTDYQRTLATWYIQVGRKEDAVPLLQKVAAHLQAEFDAGIRHPETLKAAASAYGWLGQTDTALEMLDLAINYGGYNIDLCCDAGGWTGDEKHWWDELEDNPRFIQSRSRMQALVEQKKSNIRSLLAQHDIEKLVQSLIVPPQASAQSE